MNLLGSHPGLTIIQFCVVAIASFTAGWNWRMERWFKRAGKGDLSLLIVLISIVFWYWLRFNLTIAVLEIIFGIAMLIWGNSQAYRHIVKDYVEQIPTPKYPFPRRW